MSPPSVLDLLGRGYDHWLVAEYRTVLATLAGVVLLLSTAAGTAMALPTIRMEMRGMTLMYMLRELKDLGLRKQLLWLTEADLQANLSMYNVGCGVYVFHKGWWSVRSEYV